MWLFDRPIAHRGLHNETMTENSMAAFKNAVEKGYNIETDVHVLKTGEVVVFHDFTLKRVCGKNVKISDLTLDDIKSENYLLPNGEHIPLFSELIALAEGKTGILLELKFNGLNYDVERAVIKLIKGKENFIAVQAFNPLTIIWFKKHAPEFIRGSLSANGILFLTKLAFKAMEPDFLAYNVNELATANKRYNKKGDLNILCWTVRKKEHLQNAIEQKANNIIFEKLDLEQENFVQTSLREGKITR